MVGNSGMPSHVPEDGGGRSARKLHRADRLLCEREVLMMTGWPSREYRNKRVRTQGFRTRAIASQGSESMSADVPDREHLGGGALHRRQQPLQIRRQPPPRLHPPEPRPKPSQQRRKLISPRRAICHRRHGFSPTTTPYHKSTAVVLGWIEWIEENLPFGRAQASRYLRIAKSDDSRVNHSDTDSKSLRGALRKLIAPRPLGERVGVALADVQDALYSST
jgi:hypothetical protein